MQIKGITATMIFESSALNRDEKLAGNILSIKKLNRQQGIYSYIGRSSTRHHLFLTLNELFDWEEAPVTVNQKVVQFDFPRANIVRYPEMDLFGFMNTQKGKSKATKKGEQSSEADDGSSNEISVVRKAPLGMTKAVSLEPWYSDMGFYANHDMVARLQRSKGEGTPDPYQKEEHYSVYKTSFTLDLCRFGYQEITAASLPDSISSYVADLEQVKEDEVITQVSHHNLQGCCNLWYKIEENDRSLGYIGIDNQNAKTRVVFAVTDEEWKRRLYQVLTVLKNGIMFHSSTEDYGMVPRFLAVASLRVPVPVLHSAVELKDGRVDTDTLASGLSNDYVLSAYVNGYPGMIDATGLKKTVGWEQLLEELDLSDQAR